MATNFGQMLAAAQAQYTPEQERKRAQSQAQESEFEVGKEKKSQMDELQALMEAEMERASGKKGMFGGHFGNIGKLLSFIPGVGTGIGAGFQALEGMGQASAQKKALKALMKDPRFAKYKGTWLGDPTKAFMKDVKGLAGDIDPLMTGLTSLATSMATGKISKGIGEKFKGAFSPEGAGGISEQITGKAGGVGIRPDLLGEGGTLDLSKTLDPRFAPGGVEGIGGKFDVLGGTKFGGATGGGFKELFGGDKDWLMDLIGQAGKGTENLQAIPLLMQLFGRGGAGQESDTSGYFN